MRNRTKHATTEVPIVNDELRLQIKYGQLRKCSVIGHLSNVCCIDYKRPTYVLIVSLLKFDFDIQQNYLLRLMEHIELQQPFSLPYTGNYRFTTALAVNGPAYCSVA